MMPTHIPRRRLFVVALLAAGFTLGMLPPAFGEQDPPPTVLEEVDVPAAALAAGSETVRATRGTLRSAAGGWTRGHRVCGDITFTSAAVAWRHATADRGEEGHDDEGHEIGVTLRWGDEDALGPAFRTVALTDERPDPGVEGNGLVASPVVWTDEARCLELRMEVPEDARITDVEITLINASGTASTHTVLGSLAAGLNRAMARLWGVIPAEAAAPKPSIIRRSAWGADESRRNQWSGCDAPQYANRLKMAYVHHTVNGNGYSRSQADDLVRSIYSYHTGSSRRYCDIAYNFLVDRFGRIYEGRRGGMSKPVIGGHAMGFNTGSTGVAVIGDFSSRSAPRSVIKALKRLLAWRLDVAHLKPTGFTRMVSGGGSSQKYKQGESVRLPKISGHRQTGYTTCPGDGLWSKLRGIRRGAERRGPPKIWNPRPFTGTVQQTGDGERYRAIFSRPVRWDVTIRDSGGSIVRRARGSSSRLSWTWDGAFGPRWGPAGAPVPPGDYIATITARDSRGRSARPAAIPTAVSA